MSDSINYISNSSNLSSSTSLEQNNKFITVKYLNEYNKKLCESVIDIVNSAVETVAGQSCAFLSENSGVLDMHYARNTSGDQILTATKGDNNIITVDVNGCLNVQSELTSNTMKTSDAVINNLTVENQVQAVELTADAIHTNLIGNIPSSSEPFYIKDVDTIYARKITKIPELSNVTLDYAIFGESNPLPKLKPMRINGDNSQYRGIAWTRGNGITEAVPYIIRGGELESDNPDAAKTLVWNSNIHPDRPVKIKISGGTLELITDNNTSYCKWTPNNESEESFCFKVEPYVPQNNNE